VPTIILCIKSVLGDMYMEYILVIFNNRTDTMRLYDYLRRIGVKGVVVPTPNQLSSSCGLSLRCRYTSLNRVIVAIRSLNIRSSFKIFGEQRGFGRMQYTKIV